MTNFAASRILYIYQGFESHCSPMSVLSRARKSYSSLGPIRYIPGRVAQIEKTQNCKSLQDSAKNEVPISETPVFGLRNLDGRRIQNSRFNDEKSSPNNIFEQIGGCSGIEESDELVREAFDTDYENMDELNTISKADGDGFKKTREEIEQVAVGLLAARTMTVIEMQKKLRGQKYPSDIVESVITDFKSRGLLNDGMYAESFTRSRWISSTWGPRRIKHGLLQKGVSETEAERAIKQVFEEEDEPESDGQNMHHGMCKIAIDRLFLQASKQWLRGQDTVAGNRRARIARWLRYRGFDWGITSYILKRLESEYRT